MSVHLFEHGRVPYGGQRVRGIIVTCGRCGVTHPVPMNTFAHDIGKRARDADRKETEVATRRLEKLGWRISLKSASHHRCPGCRDKPAMNNTLKVAAEAVFKGGNGSAPPPPQSAPPPLLAEIGKQSLPKPESEKRQARVLPSVQSKPSQSDDERIAEMLQRVYLTNVPVPRYAPSWSDRAIAKQLGVELVKVREARRKLGGFMTGQYSSQTQELVREKRQKDRAWKEKRKERRERHAEDINAALKSYGAEHAAQELITEMRAMIRAMGELNENYRKMMLLADKVYKAASKSD